jgi:4-alpha-glucanotransferase
MEVEKLQRGCGILCHISSLPNEYGIGSLGKEAYEFVDMLAKYGIKYWQILPLTQTGYGDSPYQSVCCNSGNAYFIDLEQLKGLGLLDEEELNSAKRAKGNVDYGDLYNSRYDLLRRAYQRFSIKDKQFVAFMEEGMFDDYAMFMSLKSRYGVSFDQFPSAYKYREELAMNEFKDSIYKSDYCFWQFIQYIFIKQWMALKQYANDKGIKIIGDIPLYVAYDSSDVWSHPELFKLDEELKPTKVAGVPPDYFSAEGQLWGNPIYNWKVLADRNYDWWVDRIAYASKLYDIVRIDHFRGLDRYYTVRYGAVNAIEGEWEDGPKKALFEAAYNRLGRLSVIAEDLGVMDDGVVKLRDGCDFPGMKIMMFAFDGNENNDYLPQNIKENSVTYTGTHDNDTALGFIKNMDEATKIKFKKQLRATVRKLGVYIPVVDDEDAAQALVLIALNTKSDLVVLPIQDVLGLDNSARMNTPSTSGGNWQFRLDKMPSRNKMAVLKNLIYQANR